MSLEKKIDQITETVLNIDSDIEELKTSINERTSEITKSLLEVSMQLQKSNDNFFKIVEKLNSHDNKFIQQDKIIRNLKIWLTILSLIQ